MLLQVTMAMFKNFFSRFFSSGTIKPSGKKRRREPMTCKVCGAYGWVGDNLTQEWFCYLHAAEHFRDIETLPSLAAIKKMHEEWNDD